MRKQYTIIDAERASILPRASTLTTNVEALGSDKMQVSDGYHTMDELYNHRIELFIAFCRILSGDDDFQPTCTVWKSKRHSDGELCFGTGTQFVLGIYKENGRQISYHIPIERWDELPLAQELDRAPVWDGHTSDDVIKRLRAFDGL